MSANLTDSRRRVVPAWCDVSHMGIQRSERGESTRVYSIPHEADDADDEETKFITRAVIWTLVLAVTPLILFYILTFFNPDLFWIPITPS